MSIHTLYLERLDDSEEELARRTELIMQLTAKVAELQAEVDALTLALSVPGGHLRPRDGKPCEYTARKICTKCGWANKEIQNHINYSK